MIWYHILEEWIPQLQRVKTYKLAQQPASQFLASYSKVTHTER